MSNPPNQQEQRFELRRLSTGNSKEDIFEAERKQCTHKRQNKLLCSLDTKPFIQQDKENESGCVQSSCENVVEWNAVIATYLLMEGNTVLCGPRHWACVMVAE